METPRGIFPVGKGSLIFPNVEETWLVAWLDGHGSIADWREVGGWKSLNMKKLPAFLPEHVGEDSCFGQATSPLQMGTWPLWRVEFQRRSAMSRTTDTKRQRLSRSSAALSSLGLNQQPTSEQCETNPCCWWLVGGLCYPVVIGDYINPIGESL